MGVLAIKLRRDVMRLWPQVIAIALVMAAGVATLVLGAGAYQSLSTTRTLYYEENRFGDLFATVTRAPRSLIPQIAAIGGVAAAEGRIEQIALADLPDQPEPASVLLVSVPGGAGPRLNRPHLRTGRLPEPGSAEAVASESFASAHGLASGGVIRILINGRQRAVRITGTALSPDFIYALGPGELMPDERRFGILWMPEDVLGPAYDLDGAFNTMSLRLVRGASAAEVTKRLDGLLERYGGRGAYGRKDQQSHAFIDAELHQLRAMSRILPPIFLVVSAFLVNMTLSRLVALEREQIGLLRAMGYGAGAVARHYLGFVTVIAVLGICIGVAAGIWLGYGMTRLYASFFSFPFLVFTRDPRIYAIAAAISYGAAVLGALRSVTGVARLSPAVAMQPPAPPRYAKLLPAGFRLTRLFRQPAVIVSRHLLHFPLRTASSVLGISLAVAILVGSLWSTGSIDHMVDVTFRRSDRHDAMLTFSGLRPVSALFSTARLPGVMRAEPFRAVPVRLRNGAAGRRVTLVGKPAGSDLSRVLDGGLRPVVLPERGLVISAELSRLLRLRAGDLAEVEIQEGRRQTVREPVAAVITGFIGLNAYMDLDAMNRMLGEDRMISGAYLRLDMNEKDRFFAALKKPRRRALSRSSMPRWRSSAPRSRRMSRS